MNKRGYIISLTPLNLLGDYHPSFIGLTETWPSWHLRNAIFKC